MNKIQGIEIVMDALMDKYSDRVPDVKKIIQAMIATRYSITRKNISLLRVY